MITRAVSSRSGGGHILGCGSTTLSEARSLLTREPRVNERIEAGRVRLVGARGEQLGVVEREEALLVARQAGLDLVEVGPSMRPPVCKVMDYRGFLEERSRRRDDDDGGSGVREPRRPRPPLGSMSASADSPDEGE